MISREEFAQEMLLRENIRKAIAVVRNKKLSERKNEILNEIKLRSIIKDLIIEAAADPEEDPHKSTGINILRDLIKNSNFLKTISTGYKSLTTAKEQRDSYRAHVVNAIQNLLAPIMANQNAEPQALEEEIEVDIEDEAKFIEGEPEKQGKEEEEEDPRKEFGIEGEDETGRDRAFEDVKNIEQVIIDRFGMLSNPDDQEMFYDYLIANTKLYFDRYEEELQTKLEEPTNPEYEKAAAAGAATPEEELAPPEEEGGLVGGEEAIAGLEGEL